MARIRTIKPEFFTSLTIASLPLTARLTFIGLWTHADDEGRCVDDARLVKAAVWPLDDRLASEVEEDIKALTEASLIARYTVSGRSYLAVNGWVEHQRINRPTQSRLPPPPGRSAPPPTSENTTLTETSVSTHGGISEDSLAERKGKEQGTGNREVTRAKKPRADHDPAFDLFWEVYPRKAAKPAAAKAWARAVKKADAQALIAAAAQYRDDPGRDPQYTAHPATWLNHERWNDQPVTRANGARTALPTATLPPSTAPEVIPPEERCPIHRGRRKGRCGLCRANELGVDE